MARIEIDSFGEDLVAARLQELIRNIKNLRTEFKEVHAYVLRINRQWFESEGRGTWEPLADATRRHKDRHDLHPGILRATDRLFESLTAASSDDRDLVIRKDRYEFRSTVPYGIIHKTGAPSKNIPQRDPMQISRGQSTWIARIIGRGIVK